jgi:hypothetical protein
VSVVAPHGGVSRDSQPCVDRFEIAGHRVFVEASSTAADGRMFTPFRFLVVQGEQLAFIVALEQNPADQTLFLFALHDRSFVSLVGGGLRSPFAYDAVKAAAIPMIERAVASRASPHQQQAGQPAQPQWQQHQQQAVPQQRGLAQPAHQHQPWPAPPSPSQAHGYARPVQPPMHVWGTAVAPQPMFVGGFKEVIFQGAGLHNPRLSGLGYMAAGALCAGGTYALIHLVGIIFIYPAALGTGLGLPGLFMVVTGEPRARPGDTSHPILVRIGLVLSFMVGSIGGLFTLQYYV